MGRGTPVVTIGVFSGEGVKAIREWSMKIHSNFLPATVTFAAVCINWTRKLARTAGGVKVRRNSISCLRSVLGVSCDETNSSWLGFSYPRGIKGIGTGAFTIFFCRKIGLEPII